MRSCTLAFLTPQFLQASTAVQIVSIEKPRPRSERVRLRLDTGDEIELAEEVVARRALRVGGELPAGVLQLALGEDLDWRAREAGLRLLSHRPRTESELRMRLSRKGFPAEVVERCLLGLRDRGLLDDAAFAEIYARDRVRLKPRGRMRMMGELRARGVAAETAGAALDEVLAQEEVGELELAREAARGWRVRAGEEPARARRRLMGFLARRGFPSDAVRQVVEETLGTEEPSGW